MKIHLHILFSFLISSSPIKAQVLTEALSMFDLEVNTILINIEKDTLREIRITILEFDDKKKKARWREKINYSFLNDSVIQQQIDGTIYYGLIQKSQIVEYDLKRRKVVSYPGFVKRDSAGYVVMWYTRFNGEDTIHFHQTQEMDSNNRIIGNITTSTDNRLLVWLNKGDTLITHKSYQVSDGERTLTGEGRTQITKNETNESSTEISTSIAYDLLKGTQTKYETRTESSMRFNKNKLLSRIEKYVYINDEEDWSHKYILTIDYKKK